MKRFFKFVCQDWQVNKGNRKGRIFLLLFRIANFGTTSKVYHFISLPYLFLYKFLIQWIFTLEIPWRVSIGENLSIYHGQALIINKDVKIGKNCTLRQCTTIGVKQNFDGSLGEAPTIGDFVNVGSNVCIIGEIRIGNHVMIGSGAVVVKNIEENSIAVGNPAVQKPNVQLRTTPLYTAQESSIAL